MMMQDAKAGGAAFVLSLEQAKQVAGGHIGKNDGPPPPPPQPPEGGSKVGPTGFESNHEDM